MTTQTEIDKLKSLPPLTQQVCGTCRFLERNMVSGDRFNVCRATNEYAYWVWAKECRGELWAPRIPILVRLKRWLIG